MIKHKKGIDNKSKNIWELWWIPSLFSKRFEHKVFASHEKIREDAIIQNEKPQRGEKWYLWPTITRIFPVVSIQKYSPGGIL